MKVNLAAHALTPLTLLSSVPALASIFFCSPHLALKNRSCSTKVRICHSAAMLNSPTKSPSGRKTWCRSLASSRRTTGPVVPHAGHVRASSWACREVLAEMQAWQSTCPHVERKKSLGLSDDEVESARQLAQVIQSRGESPVACVGSSSIPAAAQSSQRAQRSVWLRSGTRSLS